MRNLGCKNATVFDTDGIPLCEACGARMGYDSQYCIHCDRRIDEFGLEYVEDVKLIREDYKRKSLFQKFWDGLEPDWWKIKEKYGVSFFQ